MSVHFNFNEDCIAVYGYGATATKIIEMIESQSLVNVVTGVIDNFDKEPDIPDLMSIFLLTEPLNDEEVDVLGNCTNSCRSSMLLCLPDMVPYSVFANAVTEVSEVDMWRVVRALTTGNDGRSESPADFVMSHIAQSVSFAFKEVEMQVGQDIGPIKSEISNFPLADFIKVNEPVNAVILLSGGKNVKMSDIGVLLEAVTSISNANTIYCNTCVPGLDDDAARATVFYINIYQPD